MEGGGVTDGDGEFGFEVEAATLEEFLRLLRAREKGMDSRAGSRGLLRSAVFVARIREDRSSRYAFPKVTRLVVAAFAYGRDVVCCRRFVSNAVELPEMMGKLEERQRSVHEELRVEIGRGLEEANLGVPLYEGTLRRVAGPDGD